MYIRRCLKPLLEKNFTLTKYENFLKLLANSNEFQIVSLNEIKNITSKNNIVFALRHDVDYDIKGALEMAKIEYQNNIRSTYFILHTASYYGVTKKGYFNHNEKIIPILKKIQNEYGHEIGWHNDLVTLELIYGINPVEYLKEELQWLRDNGIKILGTATHGSVHCQKYKYHNKYFFHEFSNKLEDLPNNEFVILNDRKVFITKGHLEEFGFEFEAYHLDHSFEYADCFRMRESQKRWHLENLVLKAFKQGSKVIILTHPIHWAHSIYDKYKKIISCRIKGNVI